MAIVSPARVSREEIDRVKVGDWVHVRYPNGAEALGEVRPTYGDGLLVRNESSMIAYLRLDDAVYPAEIVEHRPAKRTLQVGDVFESDDFDRIAWPSPGRVFFAPEESGPANRAVFFVQDGVPWLGDMDDYSMTEHTMLDGVRLTVVAVLS